jgi:hypothetical protein
MAARRLIVGRRHDMAVARALERRHLLGSLVHEHDDQLALRMILGDGLRHLHEDRGLPRLRRRDDQGALPLPDGSDDVEDAHLDVIGLDLELDLLVGVDRRQGDEGISIREHVEGIDAEPPCFALLARLVGLELIDLSASASAPPPTARVATAGAFAAPSAICRTIPAGLAPAGRPAIRTAIRPAGRPARRSWPPRPPLAARPVR